MDDADESANEARMPVGGADVAAPKATAATSAAAPFGGAAVAVVIGIGLAALESSHVATIGGMSALIFCSLVAFIVNWIAFVPSWIGKTERFYDLMGSCTYLAIVTIGVIWAFRRDALTLVLAAMIAVWALRLGSFLFARVRDVGGDARFDNITGSFPTLLMTWTLQGLWVFVTAGAALTAMFSAHDRSLGAAFWVGVVMWVVGFGIEVVADRQKQAFRRSEAKTLPFINTGLWAWSRHPNYFGEILLWVGIAVISIEALQGRQLVALVSPVFVFLLIRFVSGVPMLEAKGRKRFGDDPRYREYCATTPVLMMRPPKRTG